MIRLACVLAFACLAIAPAAAAQTFFANPFMSAADIRAARGQTAHATLRVRYAVSDARDGAAAREVVIEAASDWALVRDGERTALQDFRLGRTFRLSANGATFSSVNQIGDAAFVAAELYNRAVISAMFAGTNVEDAPKSCDAEADLGAAGAGAATTPVEVSTDGETTNVRCDGRTISAFEPGAQSGPPPPAAFWPTLKRTMSVHPTLFTRMRASGRAPQRIENSARLMPGAAPTITWRLLAVERIEAPYPLSDTMRNETAQGFPDPYNSLAEAAVAGRALDGAPRFETWDAALRERRRRDGAGAAGLEVFVGVAMFPDEGAQCARGGRSALCETLGELRSLLASEAPLIAFMEIVRAEQTGDLPAAITAMRSVQSTPYARHPILSASFALALQRGDAAFAEAARAAGLPNDPAELQFAALSAYPYNGAYWSDVGDRFVNGFNHPTGYLFYDVAFSLPMPAAATGVGPTLASKVETARAIRNALPDFFLPE